MKPYTLSDKLIKGIRLEGGEDGYVPHLVLGRTGVEVGFVIAVNKNLFHAYGIKNWISDQCSITSLEDGRLEITAGDDQNDKRLLVLIESTHARVHHALDSVEILVSTVLIQSGKTYSLVVLEPGARIPMNKYNGRSRSEHFECWNNDGVPEIVPRYSLPEAPMSESPKPTEPMYKSEERKSPLTGAAILLFWLGIVVGFAVAHAVHLPLPM